MLEGRGWMNLCVKEFDAKIVGDIKQKEGYWYIYQPYTTTFVQFDSLQRVKDCIAALDKNESYWDYDGYGVYKSQPHKHYTECMIERTQYL